nr:M14 family zinc carboxypeptidase [Aromatoleum evansii]
MLAALSFHSVSSDDPIVANSAISELTELENVIEAGNRYLETRVVAEIDGGGGARFPLYAIALGNPDREVPAIGFFGGVHGLERIGADVVIAYLKHLVMRLRWDSTLHRQLESVRLVFMPLVNPGGMWRGTRANPNGVDLMRNAPLDAHERVPLLLGGQRISSRLPWYRGHRNKAMETESRALCDIVVHELLSRDFSIALDCHSGFGLIDRIWFPYAHTRTPLRHLAEIHALKEIFRQTHTHHPYVFEPQSRQYLTHGDLWDFLHLRACETDGRVFLPLTLEMGAWLWIKKNPRQLFSRQGIFNPQVAHRQQRVLRHHLSLLDFLSRATCSCRLWLPEGDARTNHHALALDHWYR